MKARVGEQGARMVYGDERKWEKSQLLCAGDAALLAESREDTKASNRS